MDVIIKYVCFFEMNVFIGKNIFKNFFMVMVRIVRFDVKIKIVDRNMLNWYKKRLK